MTYFGDLIVAYASLEKTVDRTSSADKCFLVAQEFERILDTYQKTAQQVWEDISESKSVFLNNGKPVSAYDLRAVARMRRELSQREPVQQQTTSTSPYDLGALARARRKRQAERSTRIVTRRSPYNLGKT